ncbi:MAG: 50S ribosomal protein L15 [Candidatus Neomarinimicrobiota bacterium]|nr:50S ribosomal protein L15 [Candidatus Neomarinimicrobiota bacterium]
MKLSEMTAPSSLTKSRKRIGRGEGSGTGKTSGRGNKGYHSRSGSKRRSWFEGGQMPLQRRVPKRGFSNARFKKVYQTVSLSAISKLEEKKVDVAMLLDKRIIHSAEKPVKILANGEIERSVEIFADAFSVTAAKKIEKAGGKAIVA